MANANACINFACKRPNFADVGERLKMAKFCGRRLWMALTERVKVGHVIFKCIVINHHPIRQAKLLATSKTTIYVVCNIPLLVRALGPKAEQP